MKCPFCKHDDDKVIDSRSVNESEVIRRRRECVKCNRRFTTYERVEEIPLLVIKKNGDREQFDRIKLLNGIQKACEKRPISAEVQDQIISDLEKHIDDEFDREIPSQLIGEFVMQKLSNIDEVAYVRFASVYRQFKDINHFMSELKTLLAK